jgi:RNA polymerase sigma factor (sigma-70 family)
MTNERLCEIISEPGGDELVPVLWEKVHLLCFDIAWRCYSQHTKQAAKCGVELTDINQECYFAFLAAVESYNREPRELKFTTFLKFPIKNMVYTLIGIRVKRGFNEPLNNYRSLDEPLPGADLEDLTLGDLIVDEAATEPFEGVETREAYRPVRDAVDKLDGRVREIIHARYFENKSLAAIGNQLDLSRERVRQLHRKGIESLRKMKELRRLANDVFYYRGGYNNFMRNGSVVEVAVERREEIYDNMYEQLLSEGYKPDLALKLAKFHLEKGWEL